MQHFLARFDAGHSLNFDRIDLNHISKYFHCRVAFYALSVVKILGVHVCQCITNFDFKQKTCVLWFALSIVLFSFVKKMYEVSSPNRVGKSCTFFDKKHTYFNKVRTHVGQKCL